MSQMMEKKKQESKGKRIKILGSKKSKDASEHIKEASVQGGRWGKEGRWKRESLRLL